MNFKQIYCPRTAAHAPSPVLQDLAREYFTRTEAYDRTVCTGPIGRDGILPATPRELGLINRNAFAVRRELVERAQRAGYTETAMTAAIRDLQRSVDIRELVQ